MEVERKAQLYWLGVIGVIVIGYLISQNPARTGKFAVIVVAFAFGLYFAIFGQSSHKMKNS